MILSKKNSEVVIVGAGLSGLMMAAQLLRYGITPTIIDQRSAPQKTSDYVGIRAQTVEIFRQMGLEDIPSSAFEIAGITIQHPHTLVGSIPLHDLLPANSAYPALQVIPSAILEQGLIHYLTTHVCPIYWNVQLTDLTSDLSGYRLNLQIDTIQHTLDCQWLIGADGTPSTVRRLMHIPLDRDKSRFRFFRSDIELNERHNNEAHLFLSHKGFMATVPLGEGRYRLLGNTPKNWKAKISYDSIAQEIETTLGFKLPVTNKPALQSALIQETMAADFQKHRCFLIGQAAYSGNPLMAHAPDQAAQDAHNLAWKLAYTLKGKLSAPILGSYTLEQKYMAQRLAQTSDRLCKLLLLSRGFWGYLRVMLIKRYLTHRRKLSLAKRKSGKLLQTGLHHRDSPLSVHLSIGKNIKAGDRLPDLPLYDEKEKTQTDLHAWCQKPGFILLILGSLSQNHLFILAQWMQQKYAPYMHLFYLPYSKQNDHLFRAFEVQEGKHKMLLIRPDLFIAYMHDTVSANLIDTYMAEVLQWHL